MELTDRRDIRPPKTTPWPLGGRSPRGVDLVAATLHWHERTNNIHHNPEAIAPASSIKPDASMLDVFGSSLGVRSAVDRAARRCCRNILYHRTLSDHATPIGPKTMIETHTSKPGRHHPWCRKSHFASSMCVTTSNP